MHMARATSVILIVSAVAVGGCGVRGSLDPPPEAKAAQQTSATAESGQGKAAGDAPNPHRGFILDGLLR